MICMTEKTLRFRLQYECRSIRSMPFAEVAYLCYLPSINAKSYIFQMTTSEVKHLHQALSGQLLPKSQELHGHVKQFLISQVEDFEAVNSKNDLVLDQLKQEWDQYNKKVSDIKSKKSKDNKFIQGGAGFLKAKQDEIKNKAKVLQSITTGLKESVTKVSPLKLSELPYSKEPILKEVFSTLYQVLYTESSQFNWQSFRTLALLHNQGEDFITRLVNLNFKDLSSASYDCLRVLKTDPKFIDICQNSKFAMDIVDIADWVDYVVEGRKVFLEKKQNEHDYDKIRSDIDKRSDGRLQVTQEFCVETLKDIDCYQNNLMNLQAEMRTLVIGMNRNFKDLNDIEDKRSGKVAEINRL